MNLRRPVTALLLSAATVAGVAIPGGASTATTWVHTKLHCAGRKTATITYKVQGGIPVDSWVDNRCGRQFLNMSWCDVDGESPKCGQVDVWPKTKAHTGGQNVDHGARLLLAPECDGPGPVESCQA